ncbi:MAG: antibiotic biosynthesis monooxygenase [Pseudomonadales bacterium]|nr:antibiotic biosynthesis monooxygenase [Pseudomonadales bacterium]
MLDMIIVHGTFPLKEAHRQDALDLMQDMAISSQAEYGCLSYEFYIGLTNPNTLLLFQEWESAEALQDHFQTAHMEQFLQALPNVLDGEVSTRRYEVRSTEQRSKNDDSGHFESDVEQPNIRQKIIH